MKYLSLQLVKQHFGLKDEDFVPGKVPLGSKFEETFKENNSVLLGSDSWTLTELTYFFEQVLNQSYFVFDQWVESNSSLKALLVEKKLGLCTVDKHLQQNALFHQFKNFISPYLSSILKHFLDQNMPKNHQLVASFLPLMNEDSQVLIQRLIGSYLQEDFSQTLASSNSTNYQDFLKPYFSAEYLKVFNFFAKSGYSYNLEFVEKSIAFLENSWVAVPFRAWVYKQLQTLDLNPEHERSLQKQFVQTKMTSHQSRSRGNVPFSRLWFLALVPIALVLVFIFRNDLFGNSGENEIEKEKTAFNQFSKEERQLLDSLIRTMENKDSSSESYIDQPGSYLHLNEVLLSIQQREAFRNQKAEKLTLALLEDEENGVDSCRAFSLDKLKKLDWKPYQELRNHEGEQDIAIKNESAYQVLILVFEDSYNEKVYCHMLSPQEMVQAKISEGEKLVFVPGKDYGPVNSASALKDLGLKHGFCRIDDNYTAGLMTPYSLEANKQEEVKLLLNSTSDDHFYILDLYQVLKK